MSRRVLLKRKRLCDNHPMRIGFLLLAAWWGSAAWVNAEFACTAAVSYQWKKEGQEPRSVVWSELSVKAEREEDAKAKLSEQAARELPRARAACAKRHEDLTGCISAKFSAQSSLMAGLSFSARKAVEEAINADCKALQGGCMEAAVAAPACVERKAPEAAGEGKEDEKGKDGADDKKKKKK